MGNIYKTWLVSNYNTDALKTPKISQLKSFACIDARYLAVEKASMVLLSSGETMDGLGSKWVMWRLPGDREKDSFWNHSVGYSTVSAAVQTPVMVHAWNGNKKVSYYILCSALSGFSAAVELKTNNKFIQFDLHSNVSVHACFLLFFSPALFSLVKLLQPF